MLGLLPLPPLPFQSLKDVTFMLQEGVCSWMVLPFSAKCYFLQSKQHGLDLEGSLKATDSSYLCEEMLLCHLPTYGSS